MNVFRDHESPLLVRFSRLFATYINSMPAKLDYDRLKSVLLSNQINVIVNEMCA